LQFGGEGGVDEAEGALFFANDALGVDGEEDADAVSGPFGDLGGWYAGVQSARHCGVA